MTITYTKLRDGSWGVRAPASTKAGDTITVTKKSGETKVERVERVLWTGDGIALCALAPSSGYSAQRVQRTSSAGGTSGRCRECRGPIRSSPEHRAMGGLCGSCAFDEYDC